MNSTHTTTLFLIGFAIGLLGSIAAANASPLDDYDTVVIQFTTDSGDIKSELTAWVAESPIQRYRGLSGSDTLPENRGMIFVYDQTDTRTITMRGMNYGLDVLFVDDSGVIRTIRNLRSPSGREAKLTTAEGRWIIETRYGWTKRNSIKTKDKIHIITGK